MVTNRRSRRAIEKQGGGAWGDDTDADAVAFAQGRA